MTEAEELRIRPYRAEDRQAAIALLEEVLGYDQPHNQASVNVDRKAAYQSELFLLAERQEQLVGAVMGGYDGHRGWIYSLAVTASARRQAIGTRLMHAIEKKLRQLGCPKINLQVLPDNEQVVRFYESLGYQVQQRISMGKPLKG